MLKLSNEAIKIEMRKLYVKWN